MKQAYKYILLIFIVLFSGKLFSQSLIYAKFHQQDSICVNTEGVIKLYMYNTTNSETKVGNFRLYFEYDPALQIEEIVSPEIFLPNIVINYPSEGRCEIIDTLTNPNNFYYPDPDASMNIAFNIKFNGVKEGVATVRFLSDSCYFHTETGENILGFYQDSPEIRIKSGAISLTLEQTGKGCSYEDKGQALITVQSGTPPYTYKWDHGTVFFNKPNQAGELPEGAVSVIVTDGNGCQHDTSMMIETLRAPKIDWEYTPEIAVIEYPIKFNVTEFGDGYNWKWKIYYTNTDTGQRDSLKFTNGDDTKTEFTYVFLIDNDYEVQLSAQSQTTGCDTTVVKNIKVEPAQLDIKNVVSPSENRFKIKANGDLSLSDVFVSYVLVIQDRTGRKVYETTNLPDEGWDGGGCPNGTYYFILKAKSTRKEYKYQGSLVILGGNG